MYTRHIWHYDTKIKPEIYEYAELSEASEAFLNLYCWIYFTWQSEEASCLFQYAIILLVPAASEYFLSGTRHLWFSVLQNNTTAIASKNESMHFHGW